MPPSNLTTRFVEAAEARRRALAMAPAPVRSPAAQRTNQFRLAAAEVGHKLHTATDLLNKLMRLARDRQTSDAALDELTGQLTQQLTSLQGDVKVLHDYVDGGREGTNENQCAKVYARNVVDTLEKQLSFAALRFKSSLDERNERLRQQSERQRREFTHAGRAAAAAAAASPHTGASPGTRATTRHGDTYIAIPLDEQEADRERDAAVGAQQELLLSQPVNMTDSFLRSRADAVQRIESTMHQLGDLFRQIAPMIAAQGELVQRIDQDTELALHNVQGGESHLMKVWHRTSANRGLILKIFGVIVVFIVLFVLVL